MRIRGDMDKRSLLENTRLFVLDMDGTYYLGDRILPGARDFLDAVAAAGKEYLFFTNNSSRSPVDYINKLARMDTPITPAQILTSGDVMITYLQVHHPGARVFLMGTPALFDSFREAGIVLVNEPVHAEKSGAGADRPDGDGRPDVVVLGFDQTLTYERLTQACNYIRQGVPFLATHPDINCPVEGGFIPDCGAMIAAMSLSTGVQPVITGKPYPETVEAVLARVNTPEQCAARRKRMADAGRETAGERGEITKEEITFVGDRLYTDIAVGVNNGAHGALVLTGETAEQDIPGSETRPDAVYASLGEMGELLREG